VTREQLEHLIRAAGAIVESDRIVVIGSQAILAAHPDAPAELRTSMEADLYPADNPAHSDIIDGAIGEGSPFHETFGYYAHGVGPETAVLPTGWERRAVVIRNDNTRQVSGICLHPVDLVISKLAAGRTKDTEFVRGMFRHRLVEKARVEAAALVLTEEIRLPVLERLRSVG
jgi:hypothetical protein